MGSFISGSSIVLQSLSFGPGELGYVWEKPSRIQELLPCLASMWSRNTEQETRNPGTGWAAMSPPAQAIWLLESDWNWLVREGSMWFCSPHPGDDTMSGTCPDVGETPSRGWHLRLALGAVQHLQKRHFHCWHGFEIPVLCRSQACLPCKSQLL